MKSGTNVKVRLNRGQQSGRMKAKKDGSSSPYAYITTVGPSIPVIWCTKFKGTKQKLLWSVNYNDPRYAALSALMDILPPEVDKYGVSLGWWWLDIDEYRAAAGREGTDYQTFDRHAGYETLTLGYDWIKEGS